MNDVYKEMQESIEEFNKDRNEYGSTLDENEVESIQSVRLIKKEVIDLADLTDKLSGIILSNDKHIDESSATIKDIKNFLQQKQPSEKLSEPKLDIVPPADEPEEGALPDLYSLRRSPFYQIKIC